MSLHYETIAKLRQLFTSGEIPVADFIDSMLGRISELNPIFNAYATVLEDRAKSEARDPGSRDRALGGIPVAVKDNIAARGGPTSCGMPMFGSRQVAQDAPCVARLRQHGAVIVGKTQMTEAGTARNHPSVPMPLNPWDGDLWPGVSSHGSAVAVATGLCTVALGTDTGGSVRLPAACNHLVGLKPTHGMISTQGVYPYAHSLDHVGILARTVEDVAAVLDCAAEKPLNAPPSKLRVGIDEAYVSEDVAPEVRAAVDEAAEALKKVDAEIKPVKIPDAAALAEAWLPFTCHYLVKAHGSHDVQDREQMGPFLSGLVRLGSSVSPELIDDIKERRTEFRDELSALFESEIDLLLAPTIPVLPPTLEEVDRDWKPDPDGMRVRMKFTAPFNFSGHPAMTIPWGLHKGRPRSVQLIAPHQGEANLILAGVLLQAVTDWHKRTPFSE